MSLNAAIPSGDQEGALAGVLGASSMCHYSHRPAQHAGRYLHCTEPGALSPTTQQLPVKRVFTHTCIHVQGALPPCGGKASCLFGINHPWSHFNNVIHSCKVGRILTELRLQIILLKYYIVTSMVKLFILIFIISKKRYHHIIPVVLV